MATTYYPLLRDDTCHSPLVLEEYGDDEVHLLVETEHDDSWAKLTEVQLDALADAWVAASTDPAPLQKLAPRLATLFAGCSERQRLQVLRALLKAQATLLRWRIMTHFEIGRRWIEIADVDEMRGESDEHVGRLVFQSGAHRW